MAREVEKWTGWYIASTEEAKKEAGSPVQSVEISDKGVREEGDSGHWYWYRVLSIKYKNAYLNIEQSESW